MFNCFDYSAKNPSTGIAESQEDNEEYLQQSMIHGHHIYIHIYNLMGEHER